MFENQVINSYLSKRRKKIIKSMRNWTNDTNRHSSKKIWLSKIYLIIG